jgi:hypothetical protein
MQYILNYNLIYRLDVYSLNIVIDKNYIFKNRLNLIKKGFQIDRFKTPF